MGKHITMAEVQAQILPWVALGTLRDWRKKGIGPRSFVVGGRVVYNLDEVQAWVRDREDKSVRGDAT